MEEKKKAFQTKPSDKIKGKEDKSKEKEVKIKGREDKSNWENFSDVRQKVENDQKTIF